MKVRKVFSTLSTLSIAFSNVSSAYAQNLSPAARAMQAAADACMRNYGSPDHLVPALRDAGFAVTPGMDAGSYEFSGFGVFGVVVAENSRTFCSVQSPQVPLELARGIGLGLARSIFGYNSNTENGTPEGRRGPCDGLNLLAPQRVIWIHYAQAGNSGECVEDGSSAIILEM